MAPENFKMEVEMSNTKIDRKNLRNKRAYADRNTDNAKAWVEFCNKNL